MDTGSGIVIDRAGLLDEVRRARLGVEGDIPGGFGYRVEFDFAGDSAELTNGYLTYRAAGAALTLGQHNNFQSLEELTSSNDSTTIERAAFTDAFGFERRIGLSAQYTTGDVFLQGGVFTKNAEDLNDGRDGVISFDGRAVYAPKMGKTQLHLGGSAHWRDLGSNLTMTRYRQRPLIHATSTRFIDTKSIAGVDAETSYGLEALAIAGRFHMAGEAYWLNLSRAGATDAGFFGGYAELGYFLVGDGYGYRGGVLGAPNIANPATEGGVGAVALNLRYDHLDLTDSGAGIVGGTQHGIIAAVSWWPNANLRLIANYGHLRYDDAVISGPNGERDYAADVFAARFQITF